MRIALILFFLVLSQGMSFSQSSWELKTQIKEHNYYLLKGEIDGKYPVEMYLTNSWEFCGNSNNDRWNARGLKGWYRYTKVNKKIPLIGSIKDNSPDYFVKLFVPENPLDSIDKKTCEVKGFKEVFEAPHCCDIGRMQWRMSGNETNLPVQLEEIHKHSFKTEARLIFEINDIPMMMMDLSSMTEIEYIQDVKILSKKLVKDNFHIVIEFGHRTNPGSSGSGHCGAGFERYLGYLKINNSLELKQFEFFQTESCIKSVFEVYLYDKEYPEKGIYKKG